MYKRINLKLDYWSYGKTDESLINKVLSKYSNFYVINIEIETNVSNSTKYATIHLFINKPVETTNEQPEYTSHELAKMLLNKLWKDRVAFQNRLDISKRLDPLSLRIRVNKQAIKLIRMYF